MASPSRPREAFGPNEIYVDGIIGACRKVTIYEKLNRIGEGTYGIVYRARDRLTGKIYALKKVRMEREQDGLPITSLREIRILKELHHPNIVKLYEVVVGQERDNTFLVFEYVEHDIAGLVDNMRGFSESEVKCLMLQLLRAIAYLHDRWIVHRDLKLSNLLYNNKGQLKLADFGLAREFGEPVRPYTPKVITLWYRPPELLLGGTTYTTAIDVWSAGCIFGELLLNRPLIRGKNEMDQLAEMFKLLGTPNDRIWPDFRSLPFAKNVTMNQPYNNLKERLGSKLSPAAFDLLNKMLTYDPKKRISAREALRHSYFEEKPPAKPPELMPTFATRFDENTKSMQGYRGHRDELDEDIRRPRHAEEEDSKFGYKRPSASSSSSSSHRDIKKARYD